MCPTVTAWHPSTTAAAKDVFAAAAAAVDEKAAEAVRREKNWRFGYTRHVVNNLTLCAKSQARDQQPTYSR